MRPFQKTKTGAQYIFLVFSIFLLTGEVQAGVTDRNGLLDGSDCEVRGVWIDEIEESAKVSRILENIQDANLNTVFIASPSLGPNRGDSPKKQFSSFLRSARRNGLNVHIWISNMYRKKNGDRSDFRNRKEREAQKKWTLKMLKKYKRYVRGIHFDYIRYYEWEAIDNAKMSAVNQTVREVAAAVRKKYKNMFVSSTTISAVPTWANFSAEDVPQWFRDWYFAHSGNVYETSYAYPTVPNHMKYQQDPVGWLRESNLDAVMPMQYTTSDTDWNQEFENWQSFLTYVGEEKNHILPGIGWLEEEGHPEWGYDPAGVARKISQGRSLGYKGFVVYELNGGVRDEELVDILTVDSANNEFDAPFKNWKVSCFR